MKLGWPKFHGNRSSDWPVHTWFHSVHQTCGFNLLSNRNSLFVQVIHPHQHSTKDTYFLLFLTPDIYP